MDVLNRHPRLRARLRAALAAVEDFSNHPFQTLWRGIDGTGGLKGFGRWLRHGLAEAGKYIWAGINARRVVLFWVAGVVVAALAMLTAIYIVAMIYIERQMAPVGKPDQIVYLSQGWGGAPNSDDRITYYYTPQGAFVHDIRYDWLVNLERPWKQDRFALPRYMRSYGFIEDEAETVANPGRLPVGFAPRYDPATGEMMLDLTCAACHTGELQIVKDGLRTAVRIDGGSGHHDFTTAKPGHFALDLLASLGATYLNPFKFRRFAASVLKDRDTYANRRHLNQDLKTVLGETIGQAYKEMRLGVYPVQEGYGRTDGLGRILNTAFAVNLDDKNYRVANAPVSYPFIWEIPWFNWVQYTGSVSQPMARNVGEAMGTGARYYLIDPYGQPLPPSERFDASTKIANLNKIEHLIRKLRAPCWPEEIFGKIDREKAARGKDLFHHKFNCVGCHGPLPAPDFVTAADAPYKLAVKNPEMKEGDKNVPHWMINALSVQDIGTDPTSALNFFRYRVDLSGTGMSADEARGELRPYYETNYCRQVEYYTNLVTILSPKLVAQQKAKSTDRNGLALQACHISRPPPTCDTGALVQLDPLTNDKQIQYLGNPTQDGACASLKQLVDEGLDGYLKENLGDVQLTSVSMGYGLRYLITLVRKRAYQDMGIDAPDRDVERALMDGYAQLDTPLVAAQYGSRPLAGIWATPPFLHNGSVPSLYEMLLPAYQRSKQFYRRSPMFDPRAVGLYSDGSEKGAFLFDTTLPGNSNSGHEFRAGYREWKPGAPSAYGVIGPEMNDEERWAIIEYLKIRRDLDDPVCSEEKFLPAEKKP